MTTPPPVERPPAGGRARRFSYGPLLIDRAAGTLNCSYQLDDVPFTEVVTVGPDLTWSPAALEAARLVHLLAGVSYYKAGAPPLIDLGDIPVRPGEREFLRRFYLGGLGEFSYRNGLDLEDLRLVGGDDQPAVPPGPPPPTGGPLVPFGGGIDSIVTVDLIAAHRRDPALFVVNRPGIRFEAIESAAAVTGLAVVRAEREIDPRLVALGRAGSVLNGHVPITAIISAIAVLAAALRGRPEVVMSNEWSASRGNLDVGGRVVNHQFSKSFDYERDYRTVLAGSVGPAVDWFSLLRPFSELWVARRFAALTAFHHVVHSCNRAFYLDPAQRLDGWCGRCDKCCFIDLILSPFLPAPALASIFGGREPLQDPSLLPQFRLLLGLGEGTKPFECVGDVDECRTAVTLAAERPDRAGDGVLSALIGELGDRTAAARAAADRLLLPLGDHAVPSDLLAAALD